MVFWLAIIIFLSSCVALSFFGSKLVRNLIEVAKYLRLREFLVGFFVMAFAAALPNIMVGVNSAVHNIPQLSFGDIIGGNVFDLTVAIALAVFFSRKNISVDSKMVQTSAWFTVGIAALPMLLIMDGNLNRIDGLILIGAFFIYGFWLFSKEERFKKVYNSSKSKGVVKDFSGFIRNLAKILLILAILIVASQGVVISAQFFASYLAVPIGLVGLLIVAVGNCFPETYFAIMSARKEQNWLVLGDLMGSVIVCATLVLGLVALISPIQFQNFGPFANARIFVIIAASIFLFAIRTGKKITKKEGVILLAVYILFLLSEIFLRGKLF